MSIYMESLKDWWEDAEVAKEYDLVRKGDTVIAKYGEDDFRIVNDSDLLTSNFPFEYRVLERKPSWRDAVAVMARAKGSPEDHREVFLKSEATEGVWIAEGGFAYSDDLQDATPLIEAKVTHDAVDRVLDTVDSVCTGYTAGAGEALVIAALGIED